LLGEAVAMDTSTNDLDAKMEKWGAYRSKHSISSPESPSELSEELLEMININSTP
jgi:hypothetical protein